MDIQFQIDGDFEDAMTSARQSIASALRFGMQDAAAAVHQELLAQLVGSVPLQGLNELFRVEIFPTSGTAAQNTLMPAAEITPRKPKIVMAMAGPDEIVARDGRYVAFPTPWNIRSNGVPGVTIGDMVKARGQTFIIVPKENPAVKLWCLRGGAAVDISELRRDVMARRMAAQVFPGSSKPYLPMFFLARSVRPAGHLDIEAVRRAAGPILADKITAAMQAEGIA